MTLFQMQRLCSVTWDGKTL